MIILETGKCSLNNLKALFEESYRTIQFTKLLRMIKMLKVQVLTTTIVVESDVMICTRVVRNRINKIIMFCDGTMGDFGAKCNRVAKLDDDLFEDFDRIQRTMQAEVAN